MNRPEHQADEHPTDDIAEQLAEFDDSFQLGFQQPATTDSDASTAELKSTILRLERHWPRSNRPDESTSSTSPDEPLKVGRFEIQHEIGRGGFGVVFLALDPALNRKVALKVPRPESLLDSERQQRFASEAEAAASLDHPAIVPIYEANHSGPTPYIASAYCPGSDLGQWLANHKRVEHWRTAVTLIATLAEGIHHAHSNGVYHRDIKPSNVLLVNKASPQSHSVSNSECGELQQYEPRLTDFGLAKLTETNLIDTKSSLVIGTPLYMAPEQLEGRIEDRWIAAIDIYALGCVLFELLTGQSPINGSTYVAVIDQLRNTKPQRLRKLRSDCPADLERICARCLEKSPELRFETAAELAEQLRSCLAGQSIRDRNTKPITRIRHWSSRLQRVKDAGIFALIVNGVYALWMLIVATQLLKYNVVKAADFPKILGEVCAVVLVCHLPMMLIGWQCLRGKSWAVHWGLVLSSCCLAIPLMFTGGGLFESIYHGQAFFWFNSIVFILLGLAGQLGMFLVAGYAIAKKCHQTSAGGHKSKTPDLPSSTDPSSQKKQNDYRQLGGAVFLIGTMLLIGAWAAGAIFKVDAEKGTLVVQVTNEHFETSAKNQEITIKNIKTNEEYRIELKSQSQATDLPSGEYQFLLSTSSGLSTKTRQFTITEGQDKQVEVWLENRDAIVSVPNQEPASKTLPTAKASPANYALSFDGVDDYVIIPSLKYDGSYPLTIECLARPTGKDDRTQKFVISNGDYVDNVVKGFSIYQRGNKYPNPEFGSWAFLYSDDKGKSGNVIASPRSWEIGESTHLAVVVHGNKWRFFTNGKLWRHGTIDSKPSNSDQPFMIGRDPFFKGFFRGHADEVRISKAARYKKNFKPEIRFNSDKFTMALYHFDSGSGNVLKDSSGHKHHGKIHGAKWVHADGSPLSGGRNTGKDARRPATKQNLATENATPKLTIFAPAYDSAEKEKLTDFSIFLGCGTTGSPGKVHQVDLKGSIAGSVDIFESPNGLVWRDNSIVVAVATPRIAQGQTFAIDSSGQLDHIAHQQQFPAPIAIAMDYQSRDLVVADNERHQVSRILRQSPGEAELLFLAPLNADRNHFPSMSVAVASDSHVLFSASDPKGFYRLPLEVDQVLPVPIAPGYGSVAADPTTNRWVAMSENELRVFEAEQQIQTIRCPAGSVFWHYHVMTFAPDGTLYVVIQSGGGTEIQSVNLVTEEFRSLFTWSGGKVKAMTVGPKLPWR